tara:strand:- start:406 stop:696 length:291 start_codon:yes stop_codon:yes gene_type:complete
MWRLPRVAGVPLSIDTIKSLTRAAKDKTTGQYATPLLMAERNRICQECPYGGKRCDLCGCFVKTKTSLLNSKCPIDKWPSASDASIYSTEHNDAKE